MKNIKDILPLVKNVSSILFVLIIMYIDLFYMHDTVVSGTINFWPSTSYYAKVYMAFDIAIILLFFSLITVGKRKYAYTCTFFTLLIWELANIIYSRFFCQYFIISALSEVSNFKGFWWIEYLKDSFKASDCLLLLTTIYFIYEVHFRKSTNYLWNSRINWYCIVPTPLIIIALHIFVGLPLLYNEKIEAASFSEYWEENNGERLANQFVYDQEVAIYQYGLVRTQLYCNIYHYSPKEHVSAEDINNIKRFLKDKAYKEKPLPLGYCDIGKKKNIVFIIVESWLSCVSDLVINNIEITPNLNKLAKTEGTYFNKTMLENKTLGESSDAQILYFCGLYPLRRNITVSEILNKKLISLPQMLKEEGYNTFITIPTRKHFWHQAEVNRVYGIDYCYPTITDGLENLSPDSVVFELAYSKLKDNKKPYLHIVLTSAMHSPYSTAITGVELDKSIYSRNYPSEYINYLQKCHYTDREIGKFIKKFKLDGTFENTIFIIAADHGPNIGMLKIDSKSAGNGNIPLMIVNANIDSSLTVNDTINQLDVFPSLLDLFHIKSTWRGLGYSIFRKGSFDSKITDETKIISEKIIYSDYFNDKYQGIPVGGYNKLIDALLDGVECKTGVDFFTSEYRDWQKFADKLVYTGPLDEYFGYALGKLDWRTVTFKTRIEDTPNYQGNAVVNYTSHNEPFTRVIEHKHFEMFGQEVYDCPTTVVSEEYSTEYKEGMEPYYPVNDERNNALAKDYRQLAAKEEGVIFGGRLAQYQYLDMAPAIEQVLRMKV